MEGWWDSPLFGSWTLVPAALVELAKGFRRGNGKLSAELPKAPTGNMSKNDSGTSTISLSM
jgi:hypothetical protein